MTPTDADKVLALKAIDAHDEFAKIPLNIDRVALALAQARAEGAKAMREKAVCRFAPDAGDEDDHVCPHEIVRIIRALPTGEGS